MAWRDCEARLSSPSSVCLPILCLCSFSLSNWPPCFSSFLTSSGIFGHLTWPARGSFPSLYLSVFLFFFLIQMWQIVPIQTHPHAWCPWKSTNDKNSLFKWDNAGVCKHIHLCFLLVFFQIRSHSLFLFPMHVVKSVQSNLVTICLVLRGPFWLYTLMMTEWWHISFQAVRGIM